MIVTVHLFTLFSNLPSGIEQHNMILKKRKKEMEEDRELVVALEGVRFFEYVWQVHERLDWDLICLVGV